MKPPIAITYEDIKQRAIQSTRSQQLIDCILGQRNKPSTTMNIFWPPQGQGQGYPFFWRDRQGQGNPQCPQFNSSNAPWSMNDSAVPMDIGRARNRPFRGGGQMQEQLALTDPPKTRGACFNCGEEGHFAQNCPRKGQNRINLIDFEKDSYEEPPPKDCVATLKAKLSAMTL